MNKLPKRMREKRDSCDLSYEDSPYGFYSTGYNQGVEDLMSEVQGLVEALEKMEAGYAGMFGHQTVSPQQDCYDKGCEIVMEGLTKWRAFCEEVEKDEK